MLIIYYSQGVSKDVFQNLAFPRALMGFENNACRQVLRVAFLNARVASHGIAVFGKRCDSAVVYKGGRAYAIVGLCCFHYAGMLRCKAGGTCVPHSEVCDGIPHCPVYGEDEKYCQAAGKDRWLVQLEQKP